MAEDIRNLMFVFEDVKGLTTGHSRAAQGNLQRGPHHALRGASDDLKEKFFKNMSERAATMIREDLEIMGPTRLSDVEGAQQNIVKTVRRLETEGRIMVGRGGGDVFV